VLVCVVCVYVYQLCVQCACMCCLCVCISAVCAVCLYVSFVCMYISCVCSVLVCDDDYRMFYEKGLQAFVSFVQSYRKHECNRIFRFKGTESNH